MQEITLHNKTFVPFISSEEIQAAIQKMANTLYSEYKDETPVFMGVLNGVIMFMSDFLKCYKGNCEISFFQVSSYKGVQSTGKVREISDIPMDLKGRHVVILEDIIDSGNTLEYLHNKLLVKDCKSLKIISLFHKPDAFRKNLNVDLVGISIPNNFVVGYGLDYDGLGRNLPNLYTLKTDN